jgi:hypothetical protein
VGNMSTTNRNGTAPEVGLEGLFGFLGFWVLGVF